MNTSEMIRMVMSNSVRFLVAMTVVVSAAYAQPSVRIQKTNNSTITTGYAVGDTAQGGVVIYVDSTGLHGLVAAQTDETIGATVIMPWKPGPFNIDFHAATDGLYAGYNNTDNIVFYSQPSGIYAAYYCSLKTSGGYTDWYLPSKYELDLMFQQRAVVGGFGNKVYWSSTTWPDWPESKAWAQYFYDGGNGDGFQFDGDQTQEFSVRAVRAFSAAPLPVELVSFNATPRHRNAELNWTTRSEVNNAGFDIERNVGGTWSKVGFAPGHGTSNISRDYSFTEQNLTPGRYAYRLKQIDAAGGFTYSSGAEVEIGLAPREFTLSQNYPNPFNPSTTIEFSLPEDGRATLKIYSVLGQEVVTLVNEEMRAGEFHQAIFNADRLATGMYFAKLEFSGKSLLKKLLLTK